jgi:hypothetical protein
MNRNYHNSSIVNSTNTDNECLECVDNFENVENQYYEDDDFSDDLDGDDSDYFDDDYFSEYLDDDIEMYGCVIPMENEFYLDRGHTSFYTQGDYFDE